MTNDTRSILVATSIAPNDRLAVQKDSIASWRWLGMTVASLNTPAEIELLAPQFEEVEFVPLLRSGAAATGRPVAYISDILGFLNASSHSVFGIVNSDIYLAGPEGIVSFLADAAREGLVYGPRLEVDSFDAADGRPDPYGFDFFFFDRRLVSVVGETRFCLGMPFWDHWFPLAAIIAGLRVEKLMTPVARHIPHATSRDDSFFMFNDEFARIAIDWMNDADRGDAEAFGAGFPKDDYPRLRQAAGETDPSLTDEVRMERITRLAEYYDRLTRYVIRFLDQKSDRIHL